MSITRDVIAIDTEKLGTVYVPRLSAFMIDAIKKKAGELHPLPDPKPYEKPLPDAVIEGDVIPASQNPAYQQALAQVMQARNRYLQYASLSAVEIPDGAPGKVVPHRDVIQLYEHQLESMRAFATIPDNENTFALILHYCILTPAEYIEIVNAATREQQLTQEEVLEGLRIFRRDIQRNTTRGDRRKEDAQDIQEAGEVQAQ